jgi:hypothetical protein
MHRAQRSFSFKPELFTLDRRTVPSASVSVAASKMIIQADDFGGLLQIRDDGRGNVTVGGPSGSSLMGKASGISQVVVHGGARNDVIDFRTTGTLRHLLDLDIDLGAGNDRAYLDLYRGISGVPLNIDIEGGTGNDSVEAHFGSIDNAFVTFDADLGQGNDDATVVLFGGISRRSRANFELAGDSGADRFDLNVMGRIDAEAALNAHIGNIGNADDRVLVRYKGELDGQLNLNVEKAAARYGIQSRFALDAGSTGTLNAIVSDGASSWGSSLMVTDHFGGPKVSVLDRLENILTNPAGTKVAKFVP